MPTTTSQCCRHLGETTERAGSFLAHSQPYKETLEHSAFRIWGISCMKFNLGFAWVSGALTDNIFAVLETSEFFLSKAVNYMHSRASFRDKISCLKRERFLSKNRAPPISKKLRMTQHWSRAGSCILSWLVYKMTTQERTCSLTS